MECVLAVASKYLDTGKFSFRHSATMQHLLFFTLSLLACVPAISY